MPKRLTTEQFIEKANIVHNGKYDYSKTEYVHSLTKVCIICLEHGEFWQVPSKHVNGRGCNICGRASSILSQSTPKPGESLLEKFPNLSLEWSDKNEDQPKNYRWCSKRKVWWKCGKCQHEWFTTVANRTSGNRGCSRCRDINTSNLNSIPKPGNSLLDQFPEIALEYSLLNKLTVKNISYASQHKVWWRCKKCNFEYKSKVGNRTIGNRGCPQCKESHGEKRIRLSLEEHDILYKSQYSTPKCSHIRPLRFDFAIYNHNKLKLIEFNGEQHYQANGKWTNSDVQLIQLRDNIKRKFCEECSIPLLIIPYWEINNIEFLVEDFIEELS